MDQTATSRALERIDCLEHWWTEWIKEIRWVGEGWERVEKVIHYRHCRNTGCSAYQER